MSSASEEKQESTVSKQARKSVKTTFTNLTALTSLGAPKDRLKANCVLFTTITYIITLLLAFLFSVMKSRDYIFVTFKEDPTDPHFVNEFKVTAVIFFTNLWVIILLNVFFIFSFFNNLKQEDLLSDISKYIGFDYIAALITLSISTIVGILLHNSRFENLLLNSMLHMLAIGIYIS